MHVHHPPQRQGDTYHLVALASSTLGSLKLDPLNQSSNSNRSTITSTHSHTNTPPIQIDQSNHGERGCRTATQSNTPNTNRDLLFELVEAKTWSKMIDEKIPKIHGPQTPVRTPPGEPEMIDAWELMEGLEDASPIQPNYHNRSFSFNVRPNFNQEKFDGCKSKVEGDSKPMWLDMAESDSNSNSNAVSIVSDFDADVIKTFRKTLEELPAANPFHLNSTDEVEKGTKKKKEKVIVYFTSLRGVRKTYEDCCHVQVILKGLGLKVDERDVSMHSGFKEELKELLGDGFGGGLPKVFIGKNCIGGAEEIRRWNEEGKLRAVVEGCEMVEDGGTGGGVCEGCGDVRFVPCETCSGSCKIYYGSEDENEDNEEQEEERYGFERCPNCNENGLIRCPICCD